MRFTTMTAKTRRTVASSSKPIGPDGIRPAPNTGICYSLVSLQTRAVLIGLERTHQLVTSPRFRVFRHFGPFGRALVMPAAFVVGGFRCFWFFRRHVVCGDLIVADVL